MNIVGGAGTGHGSGPGIAGLVVAASLLAACSGARTGQGTTDESCYLALPTAAKAVGGHGHLDRCEEVHAWRTSTAWPPGSTRGWPTTHQAPERVPRRLHGALHGVLGVQAARAPQRDVGRGGGDDAGEQLLGTLILTKIPVRFQHIF